LLLTLFLLTVTVGCAGHRHRSRHTRHRTKLSTAMEKASDTHEGDRVIETGSRPHHRPHPHHGPGESHPTGPTLWDLLLPSPPPDEDLSPPSGPGVLGLPSTGKDGRSGVFALSAGYGMIKGEDLYQLNHIDISFGGYFDEKNRLEGFIGYGYALIDKTSELHSAIKDASLLSIGARYKYFTTPRYTFLGHYFTVGLAFCGLSWSYQNPIWLDDREIDHDSLSGLEFFTGMGLHLAQTEHFQLGLEVLPSMTLWSAYTSEGFDNDVFGPLYMLKLRLTLSFL
jgi:hypothetical protein